VDQRIDWAAAISRDLVPGSGFAFHVFDRGTGSAEVYQVLTNREGLRMLLKEEFPDGAVTELLKVGE
jgi:hypothetical protein